MRGKKGAEMTIGTIIIIILALAVLVFLIYGFSVGWGNMWDKILNLGGGKSNVQTVISACQIACTTNAEYDYCTAKRDVKFNDKTKDAKKIKYTCYQLTGEGIGMQACDSISCSNLVSCGSKEKGGKLKDICGEGEEDISNQITDKLSGKVCCRSS